MKKSMHYLMAMAFSLSFSTQAKLDPAQPLSSAPPYSLFEEWAQPIAPFQIFEQVYYVGTSNLSSVLLSTPQGLILIDAGLESSAPGIKANIERLGFSIKDLKYILNSHARLDQAGGIAQLKRWSGARLVASAANARQLALGGRQDFALGDSLTFPAVQTDIVVADGDSITLGGLTLTAMMTPGHLPGATSWLTTLRHNGKPYRFIYADSLATPDYYLIGNKNYPQLIEDIRGSFARLARVQADIFIANKGTRFALADKWRRLQAGDTQAFIDPAGLQRYVQESQQGFEEQLKRQENVKR
ncbi:SPR family subclass B3 metallo-beta-lactamase [Serratia marcescens]|uniref:SPR family subclass B3 metallo-beta-lactamase n=1 Tax=Serratia TaxID=613 RepID=UPI000397C5B3|nr:SPR family subclass B3 metallo-beta-lactamase [Serratia marcescens]ERH64852.1 Zn-dependent hydrolase [Serratia marcescens EGD-HP20]OZT15206.1 HARLDQ motif MBL-fold protein [Serratia marcescens]HAT4517067.1 HARLDQ motif MBL-fold protein [Serratia marcescens]HAT4520042.1 HARLDQ motif MBL-fold protein [Serratia marcescens]HAT5002558.1 HARLDQ motif MBL-fold protein [Serratia marcescens]